MKHSVIMTLLSVVLLPGCAIHQISGEVAGVNIDANRQGYSIKSNPSKHNYGGGNSFCPPGWRKKGDCR